MTSNSLSKTNSLSKNPVDVLCSSGKYGSIPDWDTSLVMRMYEAFKDRASFDADIGSLDSLDMSQVMNIYGIFYSALAFNQDIGSWDTAQMMDIGSVFNSATLFNQHAERTNVQHIFW